MTNNLKEEIELLSNCCSAKAYSEIDEATSTGRCSDCGDGCLFVAEQAETELEFIKRLVNTMRTMTEYIDSLPESSPPNFRNFMKFVDMSLESVSKESV